MTLVVNCASVPESIDRVACTVKHLVGNTGSMTKYMLSIVKLVGIVGVGSKPASRSIWYRTIDWKASAAWQSSSGSMSTA